MEVAHFRYARITARQELQIDDCYTESILTTLQQAVHGNIEMIFPELDQCNLAVYVNEEPEDFAFTNLAALRLLKTLNTEALPQPAKLPKFILGPIVICGLNMAGDEEVSLTDVQIELLKSKFSTRV